MAASANAENQVDLAHAAMPGAEQQLALRRHGQRGAICSRSLQSSLIVRLAWRRWEPALAARLRHSGDGSSCQPCNCGADTSSMPSTALAWHAPSLLDPLFAPITVARRHRPEGRRADREGRAGRRRPTVTCARRRPAVHLPHPRHRPAQPAGHRACAAGRDRHARRPRRPPPAAAARNQQRALPRLRA